jgi:phage tail protein X
VSPKAAVTASEVEFVTVRLHDPFSAHAPVHPANALFAPALAISVTAVLFPKLALQVPGQLIPAGLLVTVPDPTPTSETVTVPSCVNVAVAEAGDVMVNVQGLVLPLHNPVHDPKAYPLPAAAVSVTMEPWVKFAEHAPGQVMPAGLLVTAPDPETVTLSCVANGWLKAAVTLIAPASVTVQVAVLLAHPPPHPPNASPAVGDSVSVT